ncbi:MAG: RNA polymerase sigma factor [Planctomycetota bacterium]
MREPSPSLSTRALLQALRTEEDSLAWFHLEARFRPLLLGVFRRMGHGGADAEDLMQETLLNLHAASRRGSLPRGGGELRAWLRRAAGWRSVDQRRKRRPDVARDSWLDGLPSEEELERVWESEERRAILAEALALLRRSGGVTARSIRVFELSVLEQHPMKEVAAAVGMQVGTAHVAKHRCAKRLRAIANEVSEAYWGGDPLRG